MDNARVLNKSKKIFNKESRTNGDIRRRNSLVNSTENMLYKELTEKIIGATIEVHRILGPGLLEYT